MEIVSNFHADAALTRRKKRGFSVCSVADSRSRDYQSNPHFQCGIALKRRAQYNKKRQDRCHAVSVFVVIAAHRPLMWNREKRLSVADSAQWTAGPLTIRGKCPLGCRASLSRVVYPVHRSGGRGCSFSFLLAEERRDNFRGKNAISRDLDFAVLRNFVILLTNMQQKKGGLPPLFYWLSSCMSHSK